MQKSKVKGQNARINIEDARQDYREEASDTLALRPVTVYEAQKSKSWKLALLPFAICVLTFAFALGLLPTVLNAQGCAMCYNSASAAKAGAKEALANGVLILLAPPMVFFTLITVVVYIYRNKFRDPANWRPEHDRELQELLADLAQAKGIQQIGRSGDREIGDQVNKEQKPPPLVSCSPDHRITRSPDSSRGRQLP